MKKNIILIFGFLYFLILVIVIIDFFYTAFISKPRFQKKLLNLYKESNDLAFKCDNCPYYAYYISNKTNKVTKWWIYNKGDKNGI